MDGFEDRGFERPSGVVDLMPPTSLVGWASRPVVAARSFEVLSLGGGGGTMTGRIFSRK